MTRVSELPACSSRFGRTDIVESENGDKKIARIIICCGYREVDTGECVTCTGFKNAKLVLNVEHFIKSGKDLRFRGRGKNVG